MEILICCVCIILSLLLCLILVITSYNISEKYKKIKNVGALQIQTLNSSHVDKNKTDDNDNSLKYRKHRYVRKHKRN